MKATVSVNIKESEIFNALRILLIEAIVILAFRRYPTERQDAFSYGHSISLSRTDIYLITHMGYARRH